MRSRSVDVKKKTKEEEKIHEKEMKEEQKHQELSPEILWQILVSQMNILMQTLSPWRN